MTLRNDIEAALRAWDAYERQRGCPAVIDYDCAPTDVEIPPVADRIDAHTRFTDLEHRAHAENQPHLADRIGAHLAYLRALLGEHQSLDAYVQATQGCTAAGWTDDYLTACRDRAISAIGACGVTWGPDTAAHLDEAEGPVNSDDVPELIRAAATEIEPIVRRLTSATADYDLSIERVDLDVYWAYWLDGAGSKVRLRLNQRNARFTAVRLRQFAQHEILGHALQAANWSAICTRDDVPWVRLTSVHAQQQVLMEGLAQALPLFTTPDDEPLTARIRVDHYLQLVRAELHRAINTGASVADCVTHARDRVPFWKDSTIADALTDRGADPLLRSYLWSYPAGIDWFVTLADTAGPEISGTVLRTAYERPLTPADLAQLWPSGPRIGGPGTPNTS